MRKSTVVLSACSAGLLAVAACATAGKSDLPADSGAAAQSAAQSSSTSTAEPWSVSMERGACFGTCPMYRVDVASDGSVKFKGARFVSDTIEHTIKVAPEAVRTLQSQINAAGFKTMPTMYVDSAAVCKPYHTDAPRVTITVHEGATARTLVHDHGCGGAPSILNTLEQAIDSVAETAQWMKPKKAGK